MDLSHNQNNTHITRNTTIDISPVFIKKKRLHLSVCWHEFEHAENYFENQNHHQIKPGNSNNKMRLHSFMDVIHQTDKLVILKQITTDD